MILNQGLIHLVLSIAAIAFNQVHQACPMWMVFFNALAKSNPLREAFEAGLKGSRDGAGAVWKAVAAVSRRPGPRSRPCPAASRPSEGGAKPVESRVEGLRSL